MTSRERIQRLLARKAVDRIPNGLGGCETAGLHLLAYEKLKKILRVRNTKNRMYTFMTTSIVEPAVLDAMGGDMIILGSKLCPSRFWGPGSQKDWKEEILWGKKFQVPTDWDFHIEADGTRWFHWMNVTFKCTPTGIYFDPVLSLSGKAMDAWLQLTPDQYNPPHKIPEEKLRDLEESARWLYENTDYCIVCGEVITDLQLTPGGIEAWWMRLIEDPETAHEFLNKAVAAGLAQLKLVDQAVGKYADILMIAHDMGDVRGVTIGPALWRETYKLHYKRLFTEWHRITDMKVSLHCCGSIRDILADLIECGIDIFNPIQISAQGMQPEELKSQFGDKIIFYGGAFDAVQTPSEVPAEVVYETVKKNIVELSTGGNYIFASVHNIPGDTPEQHLEAILRAYNECRFPLSKNAKNESSW